MNRFLAILVVLAVLLSCSTASAGWRHRVAAPVVVHSFHPAGPVYAYPAPAVFVPVPVAPVYVTPYAYVYPHRFIVRGRVHAHGRHGRYTVPVFAP